MRPPARSFHRLLAFLGVVIVPWVGVCVLAWPGSDAMAQGRRASLIESDRFVERVVEGERVAYGYGNVVIDRDSLVATCDTAIYYRTRGVYELLGKVEVQQQTGVLNCRRAVYHMAEGAGDFFGDVRVVDGQVTATGERGESRGDGRWLRIMEDALLVSPEYSVLADTVFRDRLTGEGEAFGHVRIMQPGTNSLVTGEHAKFQAQGEVAIIDRDPYLTSRQQGGGPLTARSLLMRFYRQEDRVVMVDSVRIHHDQTRAWADTAVAYGRERLVLSGSPRVSMGGASLLYGDNIDFRYSDGKLRQMVLVGAARMEDMSPDSLAAVYRGLPSMDVLEGDSITVDFDDNVVRRSVVVGNAHSIYTPLDLEGEVATNDVTGDTIVIDFRRGRVDRVTVHGQVVGTYRFAKVLDMEMRAGRHRRRADARPDSLASPNDTLAVLLPDSLAESVDDTWFAAVPDSAVSGGLDFSGSAQDVDYAGGKLIFEMQDRAIDIDQQGKLVYGTMTLTAEHIKMDTDRRELYAEGDPLVEDSDLIAGETMGYNFGAKTGAVEGGVTAFDDYYYSGDEIRRFPDTTMKICSGRMTSCDLEKPHYHFWSEKMKIRMQDKIVAAPIVLRVGEVPIFALPFFFRNLKEGRRSGILFPSFDFGFSSREGRYIRDFGYYWATNDYTDFLVEGDYNEHRDISFRVQNRYVKRYTMNGGLDYSWRNGLGGDDVRQWQLQWRHSQPHLMDDYSFKANVKLASAKLTSDDLAQSSRRDIISGQRTSTFYISRNFDRVTANLNFKREERANAEDDDPATNEMLSDMTLPSLSLNFRQFTLAPALRPGQQGSFVGDLLRNTYFKHDYTFQQDKESRELTTATDTRASGRWGLTLRPPRVGIFNFSFNANASQAWERNELTGQSWVAGTDTTDGYFEDLDEWTEDTTPAAGFGGSVNTTLYGLFPTPVGRLRAIRHTLNFKTGWSQTVGLNGRAPSSRFSFDLGNRFDAKYVTMENDTTETTKKLDGFLDWSLGTSYNPRADEGERWSDINSSLTLKPGQNRYLKLTVRNVIDPKTLSLISTRFTYNLNFNLRGRLDVGEVAELQEVKRNTAIERLGPLPGETDADTLNAAVADLGADGVAPDPFFDDSQDDFYGDEQANGAGLQDRLRDHSGGGGDKTEGGRFLPFEIRPSLNYGYSSTQENRHRATGGLTVQANLTQKWEFRYTTQFDLVASTATRQQFSLNRDLHCWRLEFNRTISSVQSDFGFRVYLKSIPALKFTRGREDSMGSLAGSMQGF